MHNLDRVGETFYKLRKGSGFTQKDVAKYLDVHEAYIRRIEKDENKIGIDILEKSANIFGCTLKCFIDGSDTFPQIPIADKEIRLEIEDINVVFAINKIALNLRYMESLLDSELKS